VPDEGTFRTFKNIAASIILNFRLSDLAAMTWERPQSREFVNVQLLVVHDQSAQGLIWKVVELEPNTLPIDYSLKHVRIVRGFLPVDLGLQYVFK
jgi:hypothetical protein